MNKRLLLIGLLATMVLLAGCDYDFTDIVTPDVVAVGETIQGSFTLEFVGTPSGGHGYGGVNLRVPDTMTLTTASCTQGGNPLTIDVIDTVPNDGWEADIFNAECGTPEDGYWIQRGFIYSALGDVTMECTFELSNEAPEGDYTIDYLYLDGASETDSVCGTPITVGVEFKDHASEQGQESREKDDDFTTGQDKEITKKDSFMQRLAEGTKNFGRSISGFFDRFVGE